MNAVAEISPATVVGLSLPDDLTFEAWVDLGRDLAGRRRNVDWLICEWLEAGKERFKDQVAFDFLATELGTSPKLLKQAATVVLHFPASHRDEVLSVEHHAHVATLPEIERLSLLKKARIQHWTPEQTRVEAVKARAVIGQSSFLERDDPDYDMLMAIVRAWNCASADVRQQFSELAAESHLGVIEA